MDQGMAGLGIAFSSGIVTVVVITLILLVAFPIPTLIGIGGLLVLAGMVAAFAGAINVLMNFFEFKNAELGQMGEMTDGALLEMQSQRTKEMGKSVGLLLLLAIPTLGFSLVVGVPVILGRYAQERKIIKTQMTSNAGVDTKNVDVKEENLEKPKSVSPLKKLFTKKTSSEVSAEKKEKKFKGWGKSRRKMYIEKEKHSSEESKDYVSGKGLDNQ